MGTLLRDVKEECKDKGGEWNNGKCKFEEDEDFEDEFEKEEEDVEED